jgi:hypothetical protein
MKLLLYRHYGTSGFLVPARRFGCRLLFLGGKTYWQSGGGWFDWLVALVVG